MNLKSEYRRWNQPSHPVNKHLMHSFCVWGTGLLFCFVYYKMWPLSSRIFQSTMEYSTYSVCAKSRPTPWDPMDCSPPHSSVHGILQARILEWVAISFSRGSFLPRDRTHDSCFAGRFFTIWATAFTLQPRRLVPKEKNVVEKTCMRNDDQTWACPQVSRKDRRLGCVPKQEKMRTLMSSCSLEPDGDGGRAMLLNSSWRWQVGNLKLSSWDLEVGFWKGVWTINS